MATALGEAAVDLPWLSPCADSLVALAREPATAVWQKVRHDPGCVLLLIRDAHGCGRERSFHSAPAIADALRTATSQLRASPTAYGFADWSRPGLRRIHRACVQYARLAHDIAAERGLTDADAAWAAGLLAPLGWLALAAAAPRAVEEFWSERSATPPPHAVEEQFGRGIAAIARRLNQDWQLPIWLGTITGYLALPAELAAAMGADERLFRTVQLAVRLIEDRGTGLGLGASGSPMVLARGLGLELAHAHALADRTVKEEAAEPSRAWLDPAAQPLLLSLLELAIENHRLRDAGAAEQLHRQLDVLSTTLQASEQRRASDALKDKLTALADFAAGAAHEINNPLAVISGEAQYLLQHEHDAERRQPLQKIIAQTQRIHGILTDVLHFARPPAARRQRVDLAAIIREAVTSLQSLAEERRVQLVCPEPAVPVTLDADPSQICRALRALLQNAIEAAGSEGWAGVRAEFPLPGVLHLVVEDSGRGPNVSDPTELFNPFFSGRQAGRGRGLGLPVAWRMARQHGGDVYYDADAPVTRFVLSLPLPEESQPTPPTDAPAEVRGNGFRLCNGTMPAHQPSLML